jgi:hypothetical protein
MQMSFEHRGLPSVRVVRIGALVCGPHLLEVHTLEHDSVLALARARPTMARQSLQPDLPKLGLHDVY